jgi:type II secretory pathway predicted ATPase ExeA
MNQKLLALFGLKWNPFSPDIPTEALLRTPALDSFCWRVEQLVRDGGFALVTGDPGTGKSVALRILADRLSRLPQVQVGCIEHPQSRVTDFYRELGDLFGVAMIAHNRWGGFRALREKWAAHIDSTLSRPVLLIDEAQEMLPGALCELRVLAASRLDSRAILTVVLAGDARLPDRFRTPELLPIGSRIRARLALDYATRDELRACLDHLLAAAGNPTLMTPELLSTLCEHAAGNHRVLMTLAGELLAAAAQRELSKLDEKLYFDVFTSDRRPDEVRAHKNRRSA